MFTKFPKTLAAIREYDLEVGLERQPDGRVVETECASDSIQWAIGDALLEECGEGDPVWDEDLLLGTFKGGSKLYEAEHYLIENGVTTHSAGGLMLFREMSRIFSPATRRMNVTYCTHLESSDDPDSVARISAELGHGEVLCTIPDLDGDAHDRYGPC
jgi:hypothetical protein